MKIHDSRPKERRLTLCNIAVNNCFQYKGAVCLKVRSDARAKGVNCVNLNTGELNVLNVNEEVIELNATVVLE